MDHRIEAAGLQMAKDRCPSQTRMKGSEQSQRQVNRSDVLPDDVLLGIFNFYSMDPPSAKGAKPQTEAWQSLVHVCRRWRRLVLGSPRHLNLQLYCKPNTPAKDMLDVWPALPLIVEGRMALSSGTDNVIAALGQSNRVYRILLLSIADRQLEEVLAPMQVPFPELTALVLRRWPNRETPSVIPDSFLDGSAPRLQIFRLYGIPFPGLPKLLLSATRLVSLWLSDIPHSGYISPEVIVALTSALPSLQTLSLEFESPQSRPDWASRRPPPSKRFMIPVLSYFRFKGVVEYLEDLVAAFDTPQLDKMYINFFNQIDFDTPRLAQFINRTPKFTKHAAHLLFNDIFVSVGLPPGLGTRHITISCREPDWQLSSIEQVCNSCLRPVSTVEDLYIEHEYSKLVWKNDAVESTLWLQLFLPFTAVKNLYLSKEFTLSIAAALQELVGGRIIEVLPSLQNIFVEGLEPSGPFQKNIGQFIAARQLRLFDHPITVSNWDRDR